MIQTKTGDHNYISDVYYVLALHNNIFSLGQLLGKGYDILLKELALTIKNKEEKVIAKVNMSKNRLFTLNIKTESPKCLKAIIKDSSWLRHLRFGHLGFNGLNLLSRSKMVNGLPLIKLHNQLCKGCMKGKQNRRSFEVGKTRRATKQLQLVHTDILGPIEVKISRSHRYFINFIDDFSRNTWVYFLNEKSEALEKFRVQSDGRKTKWLFD